MLRNLPKLLEEKIKQAMQKAKQSVSSMDLSLPSDGKGQEKKQAEQATPPGLPPGQAAGVIAPGVVTPQQPGYGGVPMPAPGGMSPGQFLAGSSPMVPFSGGMSGAHAMGPHGAALGMQMAVYDEFAAMTMQYPTMGYGGIPQQLETGFLGTESMLDELFTDEAQIMMEMAVREQIASAFSGR